MIHSYRIVNVQTFYAKYLSTTCQWLQFAAWIMSEWTWDCMCQKMPGICRYQRNCTNCTSPLTVSTSKPFSKNSLISIYNTSIFLCHASTAFGRKRSCTLGKLSSVKKHLSQLTKHNPKCSVQNTILYHGSTSYPWLTWHMYLPSQMSSTTLTCHFASLVKVW